MAQAPDYYVSAEHLLGTGLRQIDQTKDEGLWLVCNGLLQLAKAVRQDMEELKKKVADIESDVKALPS